MNELLKNMNPKDVENYVNDVMSQVFGESFPPQFPYAPPFEAKSREKKKNNDAEVYETNKYVFVKVPYNKNEQPKIKIQHTSHVLYLLHYPNDHEKKKIMLPSPVNRKGTKAYIHDDLLEIQFIKKDDNDYTEIDLFP